MAMTPEVATSFGKNQRLDLIMDSSGLKALGVGQILSLLTTSAGWSSASLVRNGIHVPLTQSFIVYSLCTLIYGSILVYRRKPVQIAWHWYLLLAVVDVEANYMGVKSFQYTSITSVMLLYCWAIPCVMFLTWQFLNTQYASNHFSGVAVCVAGLIVVIFSDVHARDGRAAAGGNVALGDALVIASTVLFATLNVSEEFVVKKVDQVEYLASIGCFGMIVSGSQLAMVESKDLAAIDWNTHVITTFLAFAMSTLAISSLMPWMLQMNGATMLNLSLMTSDMWAVAVQAIGFHEPVDKLYFVASAFVVVGLLVYASAGEPSHSQAPSLESSPESQHRLIDPPEKESAV